MAKRAAKPDTHDATSDPALEGLTFEQALAQLEAIVDRIEAGEVGLEAAIADYEKGVALLKRCRSILDHAEQRITELTPTPDETSPSTRSRTGSARTPAPPEPDVDEPAPF
ncbi:MAG: exodeoxyribonuclease VII small subunit [Phycisphaerales bacterium]